MLSLKHFILTLFIICVFSCYGVRGFSISKRDSTPLQEHQPQLSPSLIAPTTTDSPKGGIETKTEQMTTTARYVPLDIASTKTSAPLLHSLAKREVSRSESDDEEEKVNGLYDPNLMILSKRSASAINKLLFALRSYDEPVSTSYENELETSNRFPANGVQRRGQKDRKVYLRCYFNAVSCF